MTVKFIVSGVAVLLALTVCDAAKFPASYSLCKQGDDKCLLERIADTFSKHFPGIPEVNLVALDPLKIEKMDIVQGGEGPINIVLNFKNVDLTGLSKSTIKKASGFTADPTKMDLQFLVPVASLVGGYKIKGKVLILPIQGDGKSNMTMENCDIQLKWTGKLVDRSGKKFYQVDKLKVNFDTTRFIMHFSNLFNGDKALGDNMNLFLNENWQDILKELKPAITDAFALIFKNVIANVFNKVPYNKLYQ
ncbi:protein takeout-like [Toxorhynchites rutilus septentrionalis]|uniref:protein takeout-like n=1 Tax=Toxorhynchites rutilus septentrionalis TaxID=329112 RepID=UPI00247AE2A9|nr:protein takeout-like [Toxorhynchites rutilus septentrionalis]